MLLAFEGTGMQMKGGISPEGLNNLSHTSSFVWNFYWNGTGNLRRYFPGPNVQGSNCDDIFRQAKAYYRDLKKSGRINDSPEINLVGYSRGAYIAMCFAQYLNINGVPVNFLGMFDPVSIDASVEGIISTQTVPNNVRHCYVAARSPITGSRKTSMNYIGKKYDNGKEVIWDEFPGSHAAIGGFPNEAGIGDCPNPGQGDPNDIYKFDRRKEITASWKAGNFISVAAFKHKLLKKSLVSQPEPRNLLPRKDWYTHVQPKSKAWETQRFSLY